MSGSSPTQEFINQWKSPMGILGITQIVGADVIRKALAQCAPGPTPIAFSFGWLSYTVSAFIALLGEGKLVPEPDYGCKVINMDSGYGRDNKSFILGRLFRDSEVQLTNEAVWITVHRAVDERVARRNLGLPFLSWSMFITAFCIVAQFGTSAVPWVKYGDWRIFAVTLFGTVLAIITGELPQWRAESFPARRGMKKNIAIVRGNGSRHVMIIKRAETFKHFLDLEDIAAAESPRLMRPWAEHGWCARLRAWYIRRPKEKDTRPPEKSHNPPAPSSSRAALSTGPQNENITPGTRRNMTGDPEAQNDGNVSRKPASSETTESNTGNLPRAYLPADFWLTRFVYLFLILGWMVILVSINGVDQNPWFLFGIGGIGSLQNTWIAAMKMDTRRRGLPLEKDFCVTGSKVMDVLMDLEREEPGLGKPLLDTFFPGGLDKPKDRGEKDWWDRCPECRWDFDYSDVDRKVRFGKYDLVRMDDPSRSCNGVIR